MANGRFEKGNIPWLKGKKVDRKKYPKIGHFQKHTKETKKKMRNAKLGKPRAGNPKNWKHTEETKKRLKEIGKKIDNSGRFQKGHKDFTSKESHQKAGKKISKARKGIKFTEKHKENISKSHIGIQAKENNPAWLGGKSFELYSVNWTETLKRSIRERDHYICQLCNELQGEITFSVHHIDYDKKNCNPDNLITLCNSCHSKTNHNRNYWIKYFQNIINLKKQIYG